MLTLTDDWENASSFTSQSICGYDFVNGGGHTKHRHYRSFTWEKFWEIRRQACKTATRHPYFTAAASAGGLSWLREHLHADGLSHHYGPDYTRLPDQPPPPYIYTMQFSEGGLTKCSLLICYLSMTFLTSAWAWPSAIGPGSLTTSVRVADRELRAFIIGFLRPNNRLMSVSRAAAGFY